MNRCPGTFLGSLDGDHYSSNLLNRDIKTFIGTVAHIRDACLKCFVHEALFLMEIGQQSVTMERK
jgi:hypothetical protein